VGQKTLPERGRDWESIREEMLALGKEDADWRSGRTAVYVFHPGDDVIAVAKDAYALYQSENALGPAAFPSLRQMEADVVSMGLSILHGPEGTCGNMTSGGTESILMAVKTCRDQARARGVDTHDAEILVPRTCHLAFDKAAHYLDLKMVRVPVAEDLRADVAAMADAVTEHTLMIVGSAPCFPFGLIDPIEALSDLALERDLWLHVDACVGGYFAPFARMNGIDVPPFDFEVPGVASISADLHKYGYAAKGASTIFHRTQKQREFQLFHCDAWPAGGMTTPTAAGTRPGGAVAGAWAVMHYLGVEGYREKAKLVTDARERMMAAIREMPGLHTIADPKLGLFTYGSEDPSLPIFAVWGELKKRGWFTGLVTEPRGIHLMLSPSHAEAADAYLADLAEAVKIARDGGESEGPTEARYA
jgi:glutamate/tyrosine decarboxylase-like PLP-dependent enzyme